MSGEINRVNENMRLMIDFGDAWNRQDWELFKRLHSEDVVVFWSGKSQPLRGREAHYREALDFFRIFPDSHIANNPYKILFTQNGYTCLVAEFTGTFRGVIRGADAKFIPPTNKGYKIELCIVALWMNREIIEERLFYDLSEIMKQIGIR